MYCIQQNYITQCVYRGLLYSACMQGSEFIFFLQRIVVLGRVALFFFFRWDVRSVTVLHSKYGELVFFNDGTVLRSSFLPLSHITCFYIPHGRSGLHSTYCMYSQKHAHAYPVASCGCSISICFGVVCVYNSVSLSHVLSTSRATPSLIFLNSFPAAAVHRAPIDGAWR